MDRMRHLLSEFASDMDLGYPEDLEEARQQVAKINTIHNQLLETKDQVISTAGKIISVSKLPNTRNVTFPRS